jgi:AAA domain
MTAFKKATRSRVFLKLAFTGPTGSVKTYSANLLASGLANGGKIAVLDTENKSASLYADLFTFEVLDISPPFTETKFIEGVNVAVQEGYAVLIIDSFSHAWEGVLDYKSALDAKGGNSYVNWNKAGAKFKDVLTAVLQSPIHVIACMRSKMDYVMEPDIRGKMVPRKIGMAPVMRDGIEYEYTTVFDGDLEHFVTTSKDRTRLFTDQRFQVTKDTGIKLLDWLNSAPEGVTAPPESETPADASSLQERLSQALTRLHPAWLTDFLIDRKQITAGQTVMDVSDAYCAKALDKIDDFRNAVTDFARTHDQIPP